MSKIYFIREKTSKFGGAEVYLSRVERSLRNQQIDCQIVNSIFPKFLPSWLRIILYNFQVCLTKKNKFYFSLERIVCPDIYRAGDGVHKVFLNIEKKSKLNPLHPVYLFLEKRCLQNAKRIIANSNMIKNEIIDTYQVNPDKIRVIYNGVESKQFDYQLSFAKLSKEFSIQRSALILLYVGSGFKRKGVEEFLQIVAKLNSDNIQAFVIGKDKNIEFYQQKSVALEIDDKVVFTGPRTDVDDFYAIGDFFILPTHYEPFSNVVLEAMSFGNIVVTTRQNGASEIISDEFVMRNPKDLSVVNTIKRLSSDRHHMKEIKTSNQTIAKSYSIDANVVNTLKVVHEVSTLK